MIMQKKNLTEIITYKNKTAVHKTYHKSKLIYTTDWYPDIQKHVETLTYHGIRNVYEYGYDSSNVPYAILEFVNGTPMVDCVMRLRNSEYLLHKFGRWFLESIVVYANKNNPYMIGDWNLSNCVISNNTLVNIDLDDFQCFTFESLMFIIENASLHYKNFCLKETDYRIDISPDPSLLSKIKFKGI